MSRVTNIDWPTPIITSGQIEAFAQILIKKGIIDKSDIEANKNLLQDLSQSAMTMPVILQLYKGKLLNLSALASSSNNSASSAFNA